MDSARPSIIFPRDDRPIDPPYLHPPYRGTVLRAPARPMMVLAHSMTELSEPVLGEGRVMPGDADLTKQGKGEPLGERIIVHGRVLDSDGRPVTGALLEVWQANSAGRYAHQVDQHPAPLDPNFQGVGRVVTDQLGRYRLVTIKPGAYPWRNTPNAWRAQHIHFSVFGHAFLQRLVTQMYFPGDPLFGQDPIFNAVPDERGRERLISRLDLSEAVPEWALAYRWDMVLRGRAATPMESQEGQR
jgi:protocatechuate 3,4-dioxygenase, beta subunit